MLLSSLRQLSRFFHAISLFLIAVIAVAALTYTVMSALGIAPWYSLSATFGDTVVPNAGQYVQIVVTVFLSSFLFFIPASGRILSLEQSHRNFHISMDDVARAYHNVHTADRAGLFTVSSEFDAVRERLAYLRDHPDLEKLEPAVMEVAAQMSQQSRHLADVYSNEKVAHAKEFLAQRQEEAERQQAAIVEALHACTEIRKWAQQVELEESVVASQLSQLDERLQLALPALGYTLEHDAFIEEDNIVALPQKPAAE